MENLLINEHERVDNLHLPEYKIIQNSNYFRYGVDAVLLSWYACQRIDEKSEIIDLGTGTGIIPILLRAKQKGKHIDALEIQEYFADLARRNVCLNGMVESIDVYCADIRDLPSPIKNKKYDIIISNPPYMIGSIPNASLPEAIARHEITWSIESFILASKQIVKDKGKLIFIHRPSRLVDLFYHMRVNGIEPKSMRLIAPKSSKPPNLVLVEGVNNARPQLTVERPLVIYEEDGEYTEEVKEIYYGNEE